MDGLRAVAVLAVIGFHAFPNLFRAGFVGVDVFFVLSGFLITSIILEHLSTGTFSFGDFYARRVKRIFPALVLVLAVSLMYGWYVLLPDEFRTLGKHVFAGTTFVSNFVLWSESGYFDTVADTKPLLHLWSLAVEEQFYLLWPLVLFLASRRRWNSLLLASAMALLSFCWGVWMSASDAAGSFYSPLTRIWELMLGAILAHVAIVRPGLFGQHSQAASGLGVLLLLASLVWIDPNAPFPGWVALMPTVATVLLVAAGPGAWFNRVVLANRPMVWLGLISYPLYLWHWPLLVWPKITTGTLTSPLHRGLLVLLSVLLAWLTLRWLERPIRSRDNRAAVRWLVGPFALVGIAAMAVMLGMLGARHDAPSLTRILAARLDWSFPGHVFSRAPNADLRYFEAGAGAARTVFIGDSNMEQYAPRIDHLLRTRPGEANAVSMVGNQQPCNLLKEIMERRGSCDQILAELDRLLARPDVHVVVVTASWRSFQPLLAQDAAAERLQAFIASLSRSRRVYLILNMPNGKELDPRNMFEGSRLTQLNAKDLRAVQFDAAAFDQALQPVHDRLRAIAASAGAVIVDPLDTLCVNRRCPVFDDAGRPLYMDAAHMTASYAARAATFIDRAVIPSLGGPLPVR